MPLHWVYPDNFQVELYRAGWKNDRRFGRIVADIGNGQFAPVSEALVLVKGTSPIRKIRDKAIYHFTLGPAEAMTLRHFIVLLTPLANDSHIVPVE